MVKKIVKFSNGDVTGVDSNRLDTLIATKALNVLVADYISPTHDDNGNIIEVTIVEVDGSVWPPKVEPTPKASTSK